MAKPTCPECGSTKVRRESDLAFLGLFLFLISFIGVAYLPPLVAGLAGLFGVAFLVVGLVFRYNWRCGNRECKHKWAPAR